MSSSLSFNPKFHREITIGGASGWVLSLPPGVAIRLVKEVCEEQERVEIEGGSIIAFDPKHR